MTQMTVDYAADMGFQEAGSLAAKITSSSSLTLDERQSRTLKAIVDKTPAQQSS